MVHGGMTLVKYLLFLFNFIFWLTGVAILVVGVVVQINYLHALNILGDSFLPAPYLLITIGTSVAILGFFGCCGAIRENYCMTMTFGVLLTVIFLLEMAACIAGYVTQSTVERVLTQQLKEGLLKYEPPDDFGNYKDESYYISIGWDKTQQNFVCCGVSSYDDWKNVTAFEDNYDVPDACCRLQEGQSRVNKGCAADIRDPAARPRDVERTIYTMGCLPVLKQSITSNYPLWGGIAGAIVAVQMVLVVLSCVLSGYLHELVQRPSDDDYWMGLDITETNKHWQLTQ